jgi:glycosyltransferase involved in cell wall biosynthesis
MKVVHAAKFYPPVRGGMETVVGDLCDGTAGDWDVEVVCANESRSTIRERVGNVAVVRAGAVAVKASVPICPLLPWHLWTHSADCVVLHEPNPIAGTALWLRTPAPRLVIWHHSDLLRPWWALPTYSRIVQRSLYHRADCVIVSSPSLAAQSTLVQCARHIAVIPFGIDLQRYRRSDPVRTAEVDAIRKRIAGPRLLFVGRLVYYKGLRVLLDAVRQWPGTLMIAGEGPLETELRAQSDALGLGERVTFLGRISDEELPAYYQASDAFVLPSIARTEAFGVVQVEAMAAGLPVISTNLPTGVPWVNQHGVSGLVVPPGDVVALGDALRRLAEDHALRQQLAKGARQRADALFSRDRMLRAFRDVVDTVVCSPERLAEYLAHAQQSACGHADPSTSSGSSRAASRDEPRTGESEARRQRQFALGVGPQRQ